MLQLHWVFTLTWENTTISLTVKAPDAFSLGVRASLLTWDQVNKCVRVMHSLCHVKENCVTDQIIFLKDVLPCFEDAYIEKKHILVEIRFTLENESLQLE